jgi:hypothetical protein
MDDNVNNVIIMYSSNDDCLSVLKAVKSICI